MNSDMDTTPLRVVGFPIRKSPDQSLLTAPRSIVGATLDNILHERHVELAMEHDRFWDVIRQGSAAQVFAAAGKAGFVTGKHELLPIPNSQILISGGKLSQNPNY